MTKTIKIYPVGGSVNPNIAALRPNAENQDESDYTFEVASTISENVMTNGIYHIISDNNDYKKVRADFVLECPHSIFSIEEKYKIVEIFRNRYDVDNKVICFNDDGDYSRKY